MQDKRQREKRRREQEVKQAGLVHMYDLLPTH